MRRIYCVVLSVLSLSGWCAGQNPASDSDVTCAYIVRANTNFASWLSLNRDDRPWVWMDGHIRKWDETTLGMAKPTLEDLNTAKVAALAWWADYQYTIKQTPDWVQLKTDITAANATFDLYSLTALTNAIAATTNATKTALTEV